MNHVVKLSIISLLTLLPFLTYAHTGHGVLNGSSMIHYLLSPMHAIPVSIGIFAVGIYFWRKRRSVSK